MFKCPFSALSNAYATTQPSSMITANANQIIELTKGLKSFAGTNAKSGSWTAEDDRLAQFIEVFGPFPKALLSRASKADQFFDSDGR